MIEFLNPERLAEKLMAEEFALVAAINHYWEARLRYEKAMDDLKDAQNAAIRDGLQGRNAEAREAELAHKCRTEEDEVRQARNALRVAEKDLEIAKLRYRTLENLVRLISGGVGGEP